MSKPLNDAPRRQWLAAREGAAFVERSDRGRLVLAGADALDFLHRTTTADLAALPVGGFATTVIQTETGRILDWLFVWRRDADLLAITGPGRGAEDLAWVDRLVIMDDVTPALRDDDTRLFELWGPAAASVLASVGRPSPGDGVTVAAAGDHPEFWLVVPAAEAADLAARLVAASAVALDADVDEAIRLERGRPLVGRELTSDANPLEARLEESIGFGKGCYPGQEVIARLITYKSLKRRLSLMTLAGELPAPAAGSSWPLAEGANAGRITSTAWSFRHEAPVAMGYLRNDLAVPGTEVIVTGPDGPVTARVLEFPTEGTRWS